MGEECGASGGTAERRNGAAETQGRRGFAETARRAMPFTARAQQLWGKRGEIIPPNAQQAIRGPHAIASP